MELAALPDRLAALPLGMQLAGAALATVLFLVVLRLLSNTFHGSAPPVEEGMPFIGGLIKFSKVRRTREGPQPSSHPPQRRLRLTFSVGRLFCAAHAAVTRGRMMKLRARSAALLLASKLLSHRHPSRAGPSASHD